MTRLLSCGRIFEAQKSIGEDGYLYGWLERLVSSANTTVDFLVFYPCDIEEEMTDMSLV